MLVSHGEVDGRVPAEAQSSATSFSMEGSSSGFLITPTQFLLPVLAAFIIRHCFGRFKAHGGARHVLLTPICPSTSSYKQWQGLRCLRTLLVTVFLGPCFSHSLVGLGFMMSHYLFQDDMLGWIGGSHRTECRSTRQSRRFLS